MLKLCVSVLLLSAMFKHLMYKTIIVGINLDFLFPVTIEKNYSRAIINSNLCLQYFPSSCIH